MLPVLPRTWPLSATHKAVLRDLVETNELAIARAEAHLYAVVPPEESTPWQVDLERGLFESRLSTGQLLASSRVQLVASLSTEDGTWVWGAENPSISPTGVSELFGKLDALEPLRPLREDKRFPIDEPDALRLATWCAINAGFLAAWPAPTGAAIALFALDPVLPDQPPDRAWCSFCGRGRRVFSRAATICHACIATMERAVI